MQAQKRDNFFKLTLDYGMITIGALIVAANVPLFLAPNHVVSTGITGLGMLTHYLWEWPIGLVTFLLNVPLVAAGIKWGGGLKFFIRTIYAVIVLTMSIDILGHILPPIQSDPLLYTLFGGVLDGVGIGLVLRGRGTTGGTDIIAQLLNRYMGIPFGQVLIVVNGIILMLATIVVGIEAVLYAMVVAFVSGRLVDVVQEGINYARAFLIVTDQADKIRDAVFERLGRGVTVFTAHGGYTSQPRTALYVVVSRAQVTILQRIIADLDPRAFVVVTEAREVLGEGFRPIPQEV